MKASLSARALATLGALLMTAIVMAPYEVASGVRTAYSAAEANSAGWVLAVRNAGVPFRI
jgi:hypothetical protein